MLSPPKACPAELQAPTSLSRKHDGHFRWGETHFRSPTSTMRSLRRHPLRVEGRAL